MRKVILRMKEERYYQTIKQVSKGKIKKKRASITLGITPRHVNRLLNNYQTCGKIAFIHGNRSRKPKNKIDEETKEKVIQLYQTKYQEANFTHFTELLKSEENIEISRATIARIMQKRAILSPKAHRKTKREYNKMLRQKLKNAKRKVEKMEFESKVIALDAAHPSRARKKYFGELLQMDASLHRWFGEEKSTLHIAIDDCTGRILGACFDKEETLKGYYHVLHQILTNYGIPYEFLTDRRTVFEYESKVKKRLEKDTFTQFGYACHQLGVKITTSSVPQAKGRVERAFGTLQSRLTTELSLHRIQTIWQANEFLNLYLQKFNEQFGFEIDYTRSVFEKSTNFEKINLYLAILSTRKVDSGHHFKFQNHYYLPINAKGEERFFKKGTEVLVIQAFDGQIFASVEDQILAVRKLKSHEVHSRDLDLPVVQKKRKKCIPPMEHPWKAHSFKRYLKRIGKTLEEYEKEKIS